VRTAWLLCQEALSQIKSQLVFPPLRRRSQHQSRNCVVSALVPPKGQDRIALPVPFSGADPDNSVLANGVREEKQVALASVFTLSPLHAFLLSLWVIYLARIEIIHFLGSIHNKKEKAIH